MRAALLILLGLVIGALGAVFTVNALRPQTPLSTASMATMQYHLGQLRAAKQRGICAAADNQRELIRLAAAAQDIEPAFAGAEADFFKHAQALRQRIVQAQSSAPVDCAALAPVLAAIGAACQNCHRQYR